MEYADIGPNLLPAEAKGARPEQACGLLTASPEGWYMQESTCVALWARLLWVWWHRHGNRLSPAPHRPTLLHTAPHHLNRTAPPPPRLQRPHRPTLLHTAPHHLHRTAPPPPRLQRAGLVFDLDGTVLDTMADHWQAWQQLSHEYGFKITVDQLLSLAGKPTKAILELLCQEQVRWLASLQKGMHNL